MPQSIIMQRVINFPEQLPLETNEFNTGSESQSFKTTLKNLGSTEYTEEDLKKYQVIHPIGDSFTGKGYLEDGTAHDIIAISADETFNVAKSDDDFLYFWGSKKSIIEHGIKRLIDGTVGRGNNQYNSQPITIDLRKLKEELEENDNAAIKGGWWRDLKIADVEVAYLGGGTVTASQNWSSYEESDGIISALRLDVPNPIENEDDILSVLLTKDGNIVVYKKVGEKNLFDIAMPLFTIAKKHLI
ncbi:hypothetical protein MOE90_14050 [Bacillus spizizenii]|nr:hypothetical protein [Bacillus spizizenii]MCY8128649.1 hypothetical protein [Bacillus spizizenii]MCY8304033.1 hypothetical protein [Bacillus spizizenii]MCY8871515.1 hypothetical protein [Bacillus spizizenii]MCY9054815.1 hypothetical protein [Bacillus spizizenii]